MSRQFRVTRRIPPRETANILAAGLGGHAHFVVATSREPGNSHSIADNTGVLSGSRTQFGEARPWRSIDLGRRLLIQGLDPMRRRAYFPRLTKINPAHLRRCVNVNHFAHETFRLPRRARARVTVRGLQTSIVTTASHHVLRRPAELNRIALPPLIVRPTPNVQSPAPAPVARRQSVESLVVSAEAHLKLLSSNAHLAMQRIATIATATRTGDTSSRTMADPR